MGYILIGFKDDEVVETHILKKGSAIKDAKTMIRDGWAVRLVSGAVIPLPKVAVAHIPAPEEVKMDNIEKVLLKSIADRLTYSKELQRLECRKLADDVYIVSRNCFSYLLCYGDDYQECFAPIGFVVLHNRNEDTPGCRFKTMGWIKRAIGGYESITVVVEGE